jgi:hypothetical protein
MSKTARPSQLMLAGLAKVGGKQAEGSMYQYANGKPVAACALGALYLGYGYQPVPAAPTGRTTAHFITPEGQIVTPSAADTQVGQRAFNSWKAVDPTDDDADDADTENIASIIIHLNDDQEWSIRQIATWLDKSLGL